MLLGGNTLLQCRPYFQTYGTLLFHAYLPFVHVHPSLLAFFFFCVLIHSFYSYAQVLFSPLLHELLILYNLTEWNLPILQGELACCAVNFAYQNLFIIIIIILIIMIIMGDCSASMCKVF